MRRYAGPGVYKHWLGAMPTVSAPEVEDYFKMMGAPLKENGDGPEEQLMSQSQYEGLQALFAGLDSKVDGMAHRLGSVERAMELERTALAEHFKRIYDKIDQQSGDGVAMAAIQEHERRCEAIHKKLQTDIEKVDLKASAAREVLNTRLWMVAGGVVLAVIAGVIKVFFIV